MPFARVKDVIAGLSVALAMVAVVCSIEAKCDEYAALEWSFATEVRTITLEWYVIFLLFT
ncbi:hypothetical protein LVJ94_13840 [Pendulispora rubella]|uniref:Uncharacterized protein n=1 Tax=Pendulispora rubella TaxID=2741070 RepID=A0ABZ2LBP5_9BACT